MSKPIEDAADIISQQNALIEELQAKLAAQAAPVVAASELTDEQVDFAAWLAREMPAGTVISDPAWWAPRIIRAVSAAAPAASVAVPPETLRLIEAAMNHMGDSLNNIDAVDEQDEEATAEAFRAIHALTSGAAPATPAAQAQQPAGDTTRPGIERAAAYIEAQAEKYLQEHASTEPDTGATLWHFGEAGRDYHSALAELAEELRALPPAPGLMEAE